MLRLLSEYLAHHSLRLGRTAPVGGEAAAPIVGLGIEVVEIGEAARREECAADVADGPFDPALFVAAGDRDGPWLEPVVTGEAQQGGIEADRSAVSLQHGALGIVVEQAPRPPVPSRECADVAAQEALHARVEEEAEKNLP